MTTLDLRPAAQRLVALIGGIGDEQLTAPTPCVDSTVGDLLDHVSGFAHAFTAAAAKDDGPDPAAPPPTADSANLGDDWRTRIPEAVVALGEAWSSEAAWTGMTEAAGVELPGEVAGLFALDELVVHAWDVAVASGQAYDPNDPALTPLLEFLRSFVGSGDAPKDGLFGPPVAVPPDASPLEEILGLTGREPSWSARR